MKRLNKTLVLCAVMILIIATIFTLSACNNTRKVEGITVEINGGGEKVVLTAQEASEEALLGKITVLAQLKDGTTKALVGFTVEDFDPTKLDEVQTVTIRYASWTATVLVEVTTAPVEPQIVSIAVSFAGDRIVLQQATATEDAIWALITVTATYDDDTTATLTEGLTLEGFDATVLDTAQSVVVKYGELKSAAFTVVVESTPEVVVTDVTVEFDGDKVKLDKESATEDALRALLTVTALKSDNSSAVVTDYEVLGLDLTKYNEDQTVTIKYGEIEKKITVYIEDNSERPDPTPTVSDITVEIIDGGDKVTLEKGATEADLRAALTVTALMSNSMREIVTDYTIEGLDLGKYNEDQVVTIKYSDITKTVTVLIVDDEEQPGPTPTVSDITVEIIDGGDKVTLEKGATEADLRAALTVTALMSNSMREIVTDYTIEGLDLGKYNEDQVVTIKYSDITKTVTVLIVDDEEDPQPEPQIVSIAVTLKDGDKVVLQEATASEDAIWAAITVTATYDNKEKKVLTTGLTLVGFNASILDTDQTVKVMYGEIASNEFTVLVEATPVTVTDITVTFDGDKVTMQKGASIETLKNLLTVTAQKSDGSSEVVTDYEVIGIVWTKYNEDQTVTISYGGATKKITVHIEDADTKGVYMIVDGGERITIDTPNGEKEGEVMLLGYTLTEKSKVVVYRDGKALTYKSGCKFNGTVQLTGEYDIYVDAEGVWVGNWIQVAIKRDGKIVHAVVAQKDDTFSDGGYSAQYVANLTAKAGDVIVIRDVSGTAIKFQANCPNITVATGTIKTTGDYTFYVKLDLNYDNGTNTNNETWVSDPKAATVESIETDVEETIVLYGVQADDIKAYLLENAVVTVRFAGKWSEVVTDYTVKGFTATLFDEEQQVSIAYNGAETHITVEVRKAYVTGISAEYEGKQIELIGARATEANILKAITVTATYNDGTKATVQCTVKVGTFNATDYDKIQEVVVCYGDFEATVNVKVLEATAESLVVEPNSVTVTGKDADEVIAAIKNEITKVTVMMNDGTTRDGSAYTVKLADDFAFDNFETTQKATIACLGVELEIDVNLILEPISISTETEDITILETQAANEETRLNAVKAKLVIKLLSSDGSNKAISNYVVEFGDFDPTKLGEAQQITIKFHTLEALTINVTVVAVPKIAVNDGEAEYMSVSSEGVYTSGDVELAVGGKVEITLAGKKVAFTGEFNGTAVLSGIYTFTVTVSGDSATITYTVPDYTITLAIRGTDKSYVLNANSAKTQYTLSQLELRENDEIVITDNKGNTLTNYAEKSSFNGKALAAGKFDVTVDVSASSAVITVKIPYYALSVVRNNVVVAIHLLELDKESQYAIENLALKANDRLVITTAGGGTRAYDPACRFKGTVGLDGDYGIYVKAANVWVTYWIEVSVTRGSQVLTYNSSPAPASDGYDTNTFYAQHKITLYLQVGDKVSFKDTAGNANTFKYEAGCANVLPASGATKKGDYTFYLKVGKAVSNDAIWVSYEAPTVKSISTNVKDTIVLYGVQATEAYLREQIIVTALYTNGESEVVTNYTISGFKPSDIGTVQTVTITCEGKTTQIKVQVLEAYVTEISAEFDGEHIELIGAKATEANILAAITVTATYNDGTTGTVQCTVKAESFNPTDFGAIQIVTICFGTVETTVKVKVIEATPDHLEVEPKSVTALGANDSDVIDNIKSKITSVIVVMTDGTTHVGADYTIELEDGFDFSDFDNKQNATIKCEGLTLTIEVQMIKQPKSISANVETISVLESDVVKTSAEAVIRKLLVITLTSTDDSTKVIDDYVIVWGEFSATKLGVAQTITVTYGTLESLTITVTVVAVPTITINDGEATYLEAESDGVYVIRDVALTLTDRVVFRLAGAEIAFTGDFDGAPKLIGDYTFTVTVSGDSATITVDAPAYTVTLTTSKNQTKTLTVKSNKTAGTQAEYTTTITLSLNETITLTDNKGRTLSTYENCGFNGTALGAGSFTVDVREYSDTNSKIWVTTPYYTLTVLTSANAVKEIYMMSTNPTNSAERMVADVPMSTGEKSLVIANGATRTDYKSNVNFTGTVTWAGYHSFYVSSTQVWVNDPYKMIYCSKPTSGVSGWYNVYFYAWNETNFNPKVEPKGWPGTQMTFITTYNNNYWYKVSIDARCNKFIFNDNGGNQTSDKALTNAYEVCMTYQGVTMTLPDAVRNFK